MEDLLVGLLEVFLELLFEALFEFLIAGFVDLLLRAFGNAFKPFEIRNPFAASFGYALLGLITGGLSLILFPHHLIQPSRLHGISLVLSPALAGLLMWTTRMLLRKGNKSVIQFESFGYGFTFAFGMALVRFFFAR
jgi:hypothetical protein